MIRTGSTLLGAIAVAAAVAVAPAPAVAQPASVTLPGGGASFPSLVLRQLLDCYAIPPGGDATDPLPSGCIARVDTTTEFPYISVGSSNGQRGWASQDPKRFTPSNTATDVTFAASEAALTASQLGAFTLGGQFSSTGPTDIADGANNCVAPAAGTGGPTQGSNTNGCYTNPVAENGPAIQIPFVGGGIVLAFDPVYKAVRTVQGGPVDEYRFQFTPRADGSGGLKISRAAFCGIFSGNIRTWDDPQITADNGGTPVWPDPADPAPSEGRRIVVVVRDDGSGTTALFTRALRAQCPAEFDSTVLPNGFADVFPGNPGGSSLPSGSTECSREGNTFFPRLTIEYARGNEGVATCINTLRLRQKPSVRSNGRIGYVNASFAEPFVNTQPFRGFSLNTADLENKSGNFIAPSEAAFIEGLGAFTPPTGAARANPLNWVSNPSGAVAGNDVADPTGATAYPIVGTANLLLYTCYSATTKTDGITGFLGWYNDLNRSVERILENNGFVPNPPAVRAAIEETFLDPTDPAGLNLFIRTAPTGICPTGA